MKTASGYARPLLARRVRGGNVGQTQPTEKREPFRQDLVAVAERAWPFTMVLPTWLPVFCDPSSSCSPP